MSKHWHYKPLAALAIALLCMGTRMLFGGQGWYRLRVCGSDIGFARVKSMTFFFVGDHRHRFDFPFDAIMFFLGLAFVGVAVFFAWRHFRIRGTNA